MMFLHANGIDIHVRIEGPAAAPALLLVHSLGTGMAVWDAQAEALSRRFRVIRADLRGHGLTTTTDGPGSIAGFAQDMLAVLDALGVNQAHVGGLSIGGMIAQSIAYQAPSRVISLILCDTAMIIPSPQMWHARCATVRAEGMAAIAEGVMQRWVTQPFLTAPAAMGLRAMLLRTPAEGYAAAAEAIAAADLTEQTATLRLPTLILVGDQDLATPVPAAEALHAAIKGSHLVILPNAAHLPTVEQPDAVTHAIGNFLSPEPADPHSAGMEIRRQVLGSAHVDRAIAATTDFDRAFQHFITKTAWGSVWTRPGLDRRTRSLLTIALMAALGHHEELKLHIRASRNTGASAEDIAETLIQVAAYAGIPAANAAIRIAKDLFKEMDA